MSGGGAVAAVVFDLDGVLLDSEQVWDEVRRAVAADAGLPWPAEATGAMQGMSTAEWSAYLTDVVGVPGSPQQVAGAVIDRVAGRYRRALPLLPGAVDAVGRLAAVWPLGLASSSPRRLIEAVLAAAGFAEAFRATVSTEEVGAGKPDQAVYDEAVRRLGVAARHAVAVEDSSNGLRSAAAAGLAVVAVPNPHYPPSADALALAAATIASLDELTVERITSVAGRRSAG
jgi:HAD superfamily hydrolase (TIGR01509 family)